MWTTEQELTQLAGSTLPAPRPAVSSSLSSCPSVGAVSPYQKTHHQKTLRDRIRILTCRCTSRTQEGRASPTDHDCCGAGEVHAMCCGPRRPSSIMKLITELCEFGFFCVALNFAISGSRASPSPTDFTTFVPIAPGTVLCTSFTHRLCACCCVESFSSCPPEVELHQQILRLL